MLFVREFRPISGHSFSSHLFHLAQRKRLHDGGDLACGPSIVFFLVVFVVLVLFSTIRLFFPPFNDDLGTMPTRRPYSWKKTDSWRSVEGILLKRRDFLVSLLGLLWRIVGFLHFGAFFAYSHTISGDIVLGFCFFFPKQWPVLLHLGFALSASYA